MNSRQALPLTQANAAAAKVLLAAGMKQTTSVSNDWLAKRFGMRQPASAIQFVRRTLLDRAGRKRVKAFLSNVKTCGFMVSSSASRYGELLNDTAKAARKPGPPSQFSQLAERLDKLPRAQQKTVALMLEGFLKQTG